jgi:hypothetical protein
MRLFFTVARLSMFVRYSFDKDGILRWRLHQYSTTAQSCDDTQQSLVADLTGQQP